MEIRPDAFLSATSSQLQARFEAAQTSRVLAEVKASARQAEVTAASGDQEQGLRQLIKISRDFESIFLAYLLKTMRDATPKSEFLGHSRESEIWGALRDEELAKNLSQAGGIGLSRLLVAQLKKNL